MIGHIRFAVENIVGERGVCNSSIAGDDVLTGNVVNLQMSNKARSDEQLSST